MLLSFVFNKYLCFSPLFVFLCLLLVLDRFGAHFQRLLHTGLTGIGIETLFDLFPHTNPYGPYVHSGITLQRSMDSYSLGYLWCHLTKKQLFSK